MASNNINNPAVPSIYDTAFSEKLDLDKPVTLFEDEYKKIELEADYGNISIPLTHAFSHLPSLPDTHLFSLQELADKHEGIVDLKQFTHYNLQRKFQDRYESSHEFNPQQDTLPKRTLEEAIKANEFEDAINLEPETLWQTRIYNGIKKASYLAATRFRITEDHKKKENKLFNPGEKTTHTYTRYLHIFPRK